MNSSKFNASRTLATLSKFNFEKAKGLIKDKLLKISRQFN